MHLMVSLSAFGQGPLDHILSRVFPRPDSFWPRGGSDPRQPWLCVPHTLTPRKASRSVAHGIFARGVRDTRVRSEGSLSTLQTLQALSEAAAQNPPILPAAAWYEFFQHANAKLPCK